MLIPTEKDKAILQGLIRAEAERVRNRPGRGGGDDPVPQAPECYVVKLPIGGIAALSPDDPDVPGEATCDVYTIVDNASGDPELTDAGFTVEVLNLGGKLGQEYWILVQRDKFGRWFVTRAAEYDRCTCLMKGTAGSGSKGNCTVDNVKISKGLSPLDDPDSLTEELTVHSKHGYDYDDNGAADIEWNETQARWEIYQLDCPE